MNQRTIMLVCAALAAASLLATCVDAFDDRYLDLGEVTEEDKQVPRRALHSIKQFLQPVPNAIQIAIIAYMQHSQGIGEYDEPVLLFLQSIKRIWTARQPSPVLLFNICQIVTILRETTDGSLNTLKDLLYARGHTLFSEAIIETSSNKLLARPREAVQAEFKLDRLFRRIMRTERIGDADLLLNLQQLDLATTGWDITPAYDFAIDQGIEDMRGALHAFLTLMTSICPDICTPHDFECKLIGFAKAFDVLSEYVHLKVQKLNEHNRLCLSLTTQMEDIKENLNRHLPNPS